MYSLISLFLLPGIDSAEHEHFDNIRIKAKSLTQAGLLQKYHFLIPWPCWSELQHVNSEVDTFSPQHFMLRHTKSQKTSEMYNLRNWPTGPRLPDCRFPITYETSPM